MSDPSLAGSVRSFCLSVCSSDQLQYLGQSLPQFQSCSRCSNFSCSRCHNFRVAVAATVSELQSLQQFQSCSRCHNFRVSVAATVSELQSLQQFQSCSRCHNFRVAVAAAISELQSLPQFQSCSRCHSFRVATANVCRCKAHIFSCKSVLPQFQSCKHALTCSDKHTHQQKSELWQLTQIIILCSKTFTLPSYKRGVFAAAKLTLR